jgi:peroxiredoxin Q/BCP
MRFIHPIKSLALALSWLPFVSSAAAVNMTVGQPVANFTLQTDDGGEFSLASRLGKGWTVLYFYPKAGTPGCTVQACAFRDAIEQIRKQNAEVYGISTDSVASLRSFREKHKLNFTLLADPDAKVTEAFGVKMPVLTMAKRWTFIIDPNLQLRQIDDDVDPALDAQRVAQRLQALQAEK